MQNEENPPTLRRIAELSGLAIPAVSRALHDAPDIGQDMRELVQGIARDIGYVLPSRNRLKGAASNVIALVFSSNHDLLHARALLIAAMTAALRTSRYSFFVSPYVDGEDPLTPVRKLVETESADAIILNQTEREDKRIRYLMDRGFPFAAHGRSAWADRHSYFDYDNAAFATLCINRLADRGRRRVLLIAPPTKHFYAHHMIEGTKKAAKARGIALRILDTVTSDSASKLAKEAVLSALSDDPDINGVICGSPFAAMGAMSALDAAGRVLGQDVDICMKESAPFFTVHEKLFVVQEDISRAGVVLARAAIQAITQPELPPLQMLDTPRP